MSNTFHPGRKSNKTAIHHVRKLQYPLDKQVTNVYTIVDRIVCAIRHTITREDIAMNFYSVRDLRNTPKAIWDDLSKGTEVIITNNGRPSALMLDISNGDFEETMRAVRQARAIAAVKRMQKASVKAGLDKMSLDEINAEIALIREEYEELYPPFSEFI